LKDEKAKGSKNMKAKRNLMKYRSITPYPEDTFAQISFVNELYKK
jgi:hypothetical protein